MRHDARIWQAIVLTGILLFGVHSLDFPLSLSVIVSTVASGILSEYLLSALPGMRREPRPLSATISSLSVLLLFRSSVAWTYPCIVILAVASKYFVRWRGRHWLNPTNFAVLVGTLFLSGWISSGQWGHLAILPLALGGFGILVLLRAGRLDSALTFLAVASTLECARIFYYGYPHPVDIFVHRLNNGALWLFTFYMLTDPQTTPQVRWARILHAILVTFLGFYLAEWWYWKDTFLWALLILAPTVPFFDWLYVLGIPQHGTRSTQYVSSCHQSVAPNQISQEVPSMHKQSVRVSLLLFSVILLWPSLGYSFCGFYVARADTKLYNSASQVVVARDEDKTVITMVNNFKGDLKEFAMVVPVPTVLEKEMVRVIDPKVVEHLDAYSAPRLVEYYDSDPCMIALMEKEAKVMAAPMAAARMADARREQAASLGVRIEAQYTVGEYDIIVLSAKESQGLETWLKQNNYNIPLGASQALAPYIRSDMKFFVAKVNLKEQGQSGFTSLRPLQFAFESPRFMLPIRLGMINADGPQDLLIYFLTKQYRVEVTNYRNPKLPSDQEVPPYIKQEFTKFYTDMFRTATSKENSQAVFTEYAWNMGWCDPCAAEPLSQQELETLGVWWLSRSQERFAPGTVPWPGGGAMQVYVTRLHVRYDAQHFPEDLSFKVTQDTSNFQGRYILRHPWTGAASCPAGQEYLRQVSQRQEREAQTLASLTGWDIQQIRARQPKVAAVSEQGWKEQIKSLFKK